VHFTSTQWLVKPSELKDLHLQSDIDLRRERAVGAAAVHCGVAKGRLIRPYLVHRRPLLLREDALGHGMECAVDPPASWTTAAHVLCCGLVGSRKFKFKPGLPFLPADRRVFRRNFPADLIALYKSSQEWRVAIKENDSRRFFFYDNHKHLPRVSLQIPSRKTLVSKLASIDHIGAGTPSLSILLLDPGKLDFALRLAAYGCRLRTVSG